MIYFQPCRSTSQSIGTRRRPSRIVSTPPQSILVEGNVSCNCYHPIPYSILVEGNFLPHQYSRESRQVEARYLPRYLWYGAFSFTYRTWCTLMININTKKNQKKLSNCTKKHNYISRQVLCAKDLFEIFDQFLKRPNDIF